MNFKGGAFGPLDFVLGLQKLSRATREIDTLQNPHPSKTEGWGTRISKPSATSGQPVHSHGKLTVMEVTLHIPDDVAKRLAAGGGDVSRRALEAIALEGYREQALTLHQISEMLGLSRVQTEDFLGQHHVPLAKIDEAELDREAALFEAASPRKLR